MLRAGQIDTIMQTTDRVLARHGIPKPPAACGDQPKPNPKTGAFVNDTKPFTLPDTVAACHEMTALLAEQRAGIEFSLSKSVTDQKEHAIPPDWDWVRRARYAHKIKGIQIQRLNAHLAELRRAEKKELGQAFMEAALGVFEAADLQDVWDVVHERHPHLRREVILG